MSCLFDPEPEFVDLVTASSFLGVSRESLINLKHDGLIRIRLTKQDSIYKSSYLKYFRHEKRRMLAEIRYEELMNAKRRDLR